VGGLDLAASRALLSDSGLAPDRVAVLHRATGGNPLAMLELTALGVDRAGAHVGTGAEQGAVAADVAGVHRAESAIGADDVLVLEGDLPLHLSRTLAAAFGRRVADLDDESRDVLLVAAVCGRDLGLVAHVCTRLGLDVERLGDAEAVGLAVVHGDVIEFRHPLIRAAIYSQATPAKRHATHRAAADALPTDDVDRRAWHLAEAVWHPDAEVAGVLTAAGEHAVARAAYSTASGAFERAARRSPDAGQRRDRLIRAADAAWAAGNPERAVLLLDEGDRDAAAGARDSRGVELRAASAARSGSLLSARDELLLAADSLEAAGRHDDAAIALADAVHAGYYLGDARTASALADRLVALQPSLCEERSRALALMATGMARVLSGRGGVDDIRAAAPLLEDPQLLRDPRRLSWLLLVPLFLREAERGRRLRELVDEVRGQAGMGARPAVLCHVARDEATTGASGARAEADYGESIRLAAETKQTTELAMSLAGLAWLESRAGRADACRAHAARAFELSPSRDIRIAEIWVGHALGDLDLSLGSAQGALDRFQALTALLERLGIDDADLDPAPELTDALLRLGRDHDAARAATVFMARAEAKGQPWACARAARALGEVEPDFDRWFGEAVDLHEQTPDRFERARTQLAYGERMRRSGRRVDARVQLRSALEAFTQFGATVWADHAAAELTATGEHVWSRSADPLSQLTPQELQVSILLADGRTTREAAAALFLSPKTVEYHLRKVYTKLGIASRAELAARIPH
jgi:DNA-binding CsgD family transcriptional regulator/tetratricopeptide (TPR) repeat protein